MAMTTNMEISADDGWVEVADNFSSIYIKANTGHFKSWRLYISEDGPPEDDDSCAGHLMYGNKTFESNSLTGTAYIKLIKPFSPVFFSIITEPFME